MTIKNMHYKFLGDVHFNVHFKSGKIDNRLPKRAIRGLRSVDIDWIWIVELRRRATPEEVSKLCEISSSRFEVTKHAS
jgi:hypothetical protein